MRNVTSFVNIIYFIFELLVPARLPAAKMPFKGHAMSLAMSTFDISHMTSYQPIIIP